MDDALRRGARQVVSGHVCDPDGGRVHRHLLHNVVIQSQLLQHQLRRGGGAHVHGSAHQLRARR